jgi:hypothetical protein
LKPLPTEPRNSKLVLGCQRADSLAVLAVPKSEYRSWRSAPVTSKPLNSGAASSANKPVKSRLAV